MFLLLRVDNFLIWYYQEVHNPYTIIPRDYNPKNNPCIIIPRGS